MLTHTPVLSLTLQIAAVEAADAQYELIEAEHLFIALCKLEGFANTNRLRALGVPESQVGLLAAEIDLLMGLFGRFGVDATTFRHELRQRKGLGSFNPPDSGQDRLIHRSPESRQIFELAEQVARQSNSPMLAVFHLLAGLLQDAHSNLPVWLQSKRVDAPALKQAAEITLMPIQASDEADDRDDRKATVPAHKADSLATRYSRDLSQLAYQDRIQFTPAHQDTTLNILKILNSPGGNNPLLLVEDARVGEEIARSVAWQMARGEAPASLKKRRIIQMDLDGLSENISYQGEFSARTRDFIQEAKAEDDWILFIKSIDVIIGSGSLRADMVNTAQTLYNALTQGKLQCFGVTSQTEFKEYISQNSGWKKLFLPVFASAAPTSEAADEARIGVEQIRPVRISEPLQWSKEITEPGRRYLKRSGPLPALKEPPGRKTQTALDRQEEIERRMRHSRPTEALPEARPQPKGEAQTALDLLLDNLRMRLTRYGIQAHYTPAAKTFLKRLERSFLPLEQEFAIRLENPLGGMLLRGEIDYGQAVIVDLSGDELVFQTEGGE